MFIERRDKYWVLSNEGSREETIMQTMTSAYANKMLKNLEEKWT